MTDPKREFTDEELIRHFDNMAGRLIGGIIQAPKSCPKCAAIRARLTRRVSREFVEKYKLRIIDSAETTSGSLRISKVSRWIEDMLFELGITIEGEEQTDER